MKRSVFRRCSALACALALLLCLFGCAQQTQTPLPSAATPGAETPRESAAPQQASPAPTQESSAPVEEGSETALFGSPWINSLMSGNMPEQEPDARDDLYLHYNFDTLRSCEGLYYVQALSNESVMTDYVLSLAADETRGAPPDGAYSEHELEQLRIFFRQACDIETLTRAGISELEPYLEKIRAAGTLEELNAVLVSEDFPFSPFLYFTVSAYDMSVGNNVFLYPDFLFVDETSGGEHFQDSDDPDVEAANLNAINLSAPAILLDLLALGMSDEEALQTIQELYDLEAAYGKDVGYNDLYLSRPFGALAAANVNLSLDELAARCPSFPLRETVVKFGKDASRCFTVFGEEWLASFNDVWTEENLELLKTMTMVKILQECQPYVDMHAALTQEEPDMEAVSPLANALNVCNRTDTFTQLFGKIYVADRYTEEEIARLTELGESLIAAFRRLIGETDWLGEASRERLLEKLDKMRLNILYPDGGYLDFSDLSLIPTEDGGSLLGNYLLLKAWRNEKDNALLKGDALARVVWDSCYPTTVGGCAYDLDTNSVSILPGFPASQGYGAETSQEALLAVCGWIVGHEISHAFDFAGAQFDAYGTANAVFDETDLDAYLALVDRLSAYYDGVEALPGTHVVGERVKTEATADLIGMQLVLEAAKETPDFDYEAFYHVFASYLFMVLPDVEYISYYLADEHPLHYLRCNVNAQMYPEFYETYGVREGDGMYLPEAERIRFWGP